MPSVGVKEAYQRGCRMFEQGQYRQSYTISSQLIAKNPFFPPVVALHVASLSRLQRATEGTRIAQRALRHITHKPHRVAVLGSLAESLTQEGDFSEGIELLREEIERQPDVPRLYAALGHMYILGGRRDEAIDLIERARERGLVTLSIAAVFGRAVIRTDRADEGVELIERVLEAHPDENSMDMHKALNALAMLHDRAGRYDEAMDTFTRANACIDANYNDEYHRRLVDETLAFWDPERLARAHRPRPPEGAPTPVFIVGMPRSGTTLTEQIIDAHPRGLGAGELIQIPDLQGRMFGAHKRQRPSGPDELDPDLIEKAAAEYRADLHEMAGGASPLVITDKLPMNFQYLGFIALLLPDARVIHCRREPRDNCLSCFFQSLSAGHAYSTDLADCGRYYRHYDRVARGLIDRITDPRVGVPVMENRYEEMVGDQVARTHALLDFVGLPFDEACLNFHESGRVALTLSNDQVRQPMYKSSTRRYERYAAHLGPLEEALGDLVADPVSAGAMRREGGDA